MRRNMIKYLIIITIYMSVINLNASRLTDSLELLSTKLEGVSKIDVLNHLSELYCRTNLPLAIEKGKLALDLSRKINYKQGEAEALINYTNGQIDNFTIGGLESSYIESLEIYKSIGNKRDIGRSLNRLSNFYFDLQNYTKSYNAANDAFIIFEKLGDKKGMAFSYYMTARVYYVWNLFDNANESLENAKKLYEQIDYYNGIADVLILQGQIFGIKGRFIEAKDLFSKAADLYIKSGFSNNLGEAYRLIASYYTTFEKKFDLAFEYINKALDIASKMEDSSRIATYLTHKGFIYNVMGNKKKNLEYDLKALNIRENLGYKIGIGSSQINVGQDYLMLNEYDNAEKYLLEGLKITQKSDIKFYTKKAYLLLNELYKLKQNYPKALHYLELALKMTDTINYQEKLHQLSVIKIENELRRKEKEINQLQENKNSSFIKMYSVIVIFVLFIAFLFIYLNYTKKKDNKILRKQREELRESEEKYRIIFENTGAATLLIDENTIITMVNSEFEKVSEYTKEEIEGKRKWTEFVLKEDLPKMIEYHNLRRQKPDAVIEGYEFRCLDRHGKIRYCYLKGGLIPESSFSLISFLDITERKNAEIALKGSEISLKELNATKDKFFSLIAHDLKSPLGNFRNILEIMLQDYESLNETEKKDMIVEMNKSSKNIYNLLDNLLNWASSQSGRIKFNPEYNDINDVIRKPVFMLSALAEKKNISIVTDLKVKNDVFIDLNMINTVIRNLITNAIKFTNVSGLIKLTSNEIDDMIEVTISDNGVGMSQEKLANLFRIDVNQSTLGTANEKGTGLGLILCKEFIEKHGGNIWAESEIGNGSTFKFVLPKINQNTNYLQDIR